MWHIRVLLPVHLCVCVVEHTQITTWFQRVCKSKWHIIHQHCYNNQTIKNYSHSVYYNHSHTDTSRGYDEVFQKKKKRIYMLNRMKQPVSFQFSNKHTHTRQIGLINFLVNYSHMLYHLVVVVVVVVYLRRFKWYILVVRQCVWKRTLTTKTKYYFVAQFLVRGKWKPII